ncbi:AAA family ATPase [Aeromonas sp. FDAARGOS 1417]|uniref:AAA family ATPase n=1 Tax=Aeromonas TaxID=642 RepID=UPI001C250F92|nr:AAA family ATPase [Aeromonas sp. FDAARGOS 1417]QWZ65852.1 AAA family ATPase [Aeromonas sp. FDAARGOS 1417]
MLEIKHKLVALLAQLNEGLVDRDEAMKLALLSLLAGENILLVGPPGTAKSLISRQVAKALKDDDKEGASHFEYLLTKFSTPEEIFGPLSISKLKEDRFERNTAGYLPSVQVAFLDEIFKASSSILNALLTILNERIYHNGASVQRVPLRSLIAASNELPTGQEELGALYDRFLIRSFVDYVSQDSLHRLFSFGSSKQPNPLTLGELKELDKLVASIEIPEAIREAVIQIWQGHRELFKEDRREGLSDRRLVKVIRLLKISALTNNRREVDLSDLMLLRHCLWGHPDNIGKVGDLLRRTLTKFSSLVPNNSNDILHGLVDSRVHVSNIKRTGVIPGFNGSGTEHDPLLIEDINQFCMLDKKEIGLQGLYFRQCADIDLSILSTWPTINFKGRYDGAGFTIIGRNKVEALFNQLCPNTIIKSLRINGCSLANQASESEFKWCETNQTMFLNLADRCEIHGCLVSGSLANNSVNNSNISRCHIYGRSPGYDHPKLSLDSYNCTIVDSLFVMDGCDYSNIKSAAGVVHSFRNCKINRCYISGTFKTNSSAYEYIGCFSRNLANSEINTCALGPVSFLGSKVFRAFFEESVNSVLFNNITIDTNKFDGQIDDANGKYGKKVAQARFNKYLFEHDLGWDFQNIWQWDDQANSPRLQSVGLMLANNSSSEQTLASEKIDLLVQQMNANIWV